MRDICFWEAVGSDRFKSQFFVIPHVSLVLRLQTEAVPELRQILHAFGDQLRGDPLPLVLRRDEDRRDDPGILAEHRHVQRTVGCQRAQRAGKQEVEVQEILLLNYPEAINILTFDNMKEILRKADDYIHEKQRVITDH